MRTPCPECPFRSLDAHAASRMLDHIQADHGRPLGVHTCHMLGLGLQSRPTPRQECRGHAGYREIQAGQPGGCGVMLPV